MNIYRISGSMFTNNWITLIIVVLFNGIRKETKVIIYFFALLLYSLQFASLPGHESSCGALGNLFEFLVEGSNSLTRLNLSVSCGGWC